MPAALPPAAQSARWAVVVFPGSNCERDCVRALAATLRYEVAEVWHKDSVAPDVECIVVPGGFSYGDYLRCGALAAHSPVMKSVAAAVARGALVIGICNGFQVLVESGLLPGVLLKNDGLRFRCEDVHLRVANAAPNFLPAADAEEGGAVFRLPIAHGYGKYFAPAEQLATLEKAGQVFLRYCDESGALSGAANPNGSLNNIAAVLNRERTVLGLMPHPERACEQLLGGAGGRRIFETMNASALARRAAADIAVSL